MNPMQIEPKIDLEPQDESVLLRDRVLKAARVYFFSHGFRSVTMDDLARELGMSKKTLYKVFSSKTEIVEAILKAKFDGLDAELQAATCDIQDFARSLHDLLELTRRHTLEINPNFVRDIRKELPHLFQFIEQRRTVLIMTYFSRLLEFGQQQGQVRKDYPVSLMIALLLGMFNSTINPERLAELNLSPREGIEVLLEVFLNGVLSASASPPEQAEKL